MAENSQYEVIDLLKFAHDEQPAKVQDAFNEIMRDKIYDTIQNRKQEIAQNLFYDQDEENAEIEIDPEDLPDSEEIDDEIENEEDYEEELEDEDPENG